MVESNAGAIAAGPGWVLSPHLSAGASIPVAMLGFLRALIEPAVRFSRNGLSDGFHTKACAYFLRGSFCKDRTPRSPKTFSLGNCLVPRPLCFILLQ